MCSADNRGDPGVPSETVVSDSPVIGPVSSASRTQLSIYINAYNCVSEVV